MVESDYSVSSLSLRDKEREREKREIELDNIMNIEYLYVPAAATRLSKVPLVLYTMDQTDR